MQDIIISSIYAQTLLDTNQGIESIIYDLSKKDIGEVSRVCRRITEEEKKGISVKEGLQKFVKSNASPAIKSFFNALLLNNQKQFEELMNSIVEKEKLNTEVRAERISLLANVLVIMSLMPMAIILIDFFNITMASAPLDGGSSVISSAFIPEEIKKVVLLISGAIILFLSMMMRLL